MLFSLKRYFFFGLICMTLASCAWPPKRTTAPDSPGSVQKALEEGRTLMARNAHIQALALLSDAYKRFRQKNVLEMYHQAEQLALSAGDQAYQQKEFAKAGMLYLALEKSSLDRDEGSPRADQNYLERQIRECSRTLAEKGLKEYREENLNAAIAAWEQVLLFDPKNDSVVQSIGTARRQRTRLLATD
jgi:hypothetical protein